MNPEFKSKSELVVEDREAKVNTEIERLQSEYPDISKADYWDALREAMIANEQFLKMIEPLAKKTPEDRSLADPEQRAAINADISNILDLRARKIALTPESMIQEFQKEISQEEINFLIYIQTARVNFINEISQCDEAFEQTANKIKAAVDQIYFFVPQVPKDGEINKYFKVGTLGIPRILTGTMIVADNDWDRVFDNNPKIGNPQEFDSPCLNSDGLNYGKGFFSEESVVSKIGLMALKDQDSKEKLVGLARHEAVHQVDFLRSNRVGLSSLLMELIAYRIDGKLDGASKRKHDEDLFDVFTDRYLDDYAEGFNLSPIQVRKVFDRALVTIKKLEKKLTFARVTSILLNCESFDELFELAKDLEK